MPKNQLLLKSRWSRCAGWMCAGVAAVSGLYSFSAATPGLWAEPAAQRSEADAFEIDDAGRVSLDGEDRSSTGPCTGIEPKITPAFQKAHDIETDSDDSQIELAGGIVREESETGFPLLRRWKRPSRLPSDPFEVTESAGTDDKDEEPLVSSSTKKNSRLSGHEGNSKLSDRKRLSARRPAPPKRSASPAEPTSEDAVTPEAPEDENPLAKRRRLLREVEHSAPLSEPEADVELEKERPAASRSKIRHRPSRPLRDLEDEVRQQKGTAEPATPGVADEPTESQSITPLGKPSTDDARSNRTPQADARLRSMFEAPELEDSGLSEKLPSSANTAKADRQSSTPPALRRTLKGASDSKIQQVAEAEALDTQAQLGDPAEDSAANIPYQALMLRARKAKEQGRFAAARQLEHAAESIQPEPTRKLGVRKVDGESDTANRSEQSLFTEDAVSSEPEPAKSASIREPTPEAGSDEVQGPAFLPAPGPALNAPDVKSTVPSRDEHPREETRLQQAPPGRARLEAWSNSDVAGKSKVDAPALGHSQQRTTKANRQRRTAESEAIPDTTQVATTPLAPPKPAKPGDTDFNALQTSSNLRPTRDVEQFKDQISGTEPRIGALRSSVPPGNAPVTEADSRPTPSLISTRHYLPDQQVLANRAIQLPPPAGWSASNKLPTRTISTAPQASWIRTQPSQNPGLPEPLQIQGQPTTARPIELTSIEVFEGDARSQPVQVLNGANEPEGGTVTDAHYRHTTSSSEPSRISPEELERVESIAAQQQKSTQFWLLSLGATVVTTIMILRWSRRDR